MQKNDGLEAIKEEDDTVRVDPLNHFHKYRSGYNITNKHYWSVSFLSFLFHSFSLLRYIRYFVMFMSLVGLSYETLFACNVNCLSLVKSRSRRVEGALCSKKTVPTKVRSEKEKLWLSTKY